MKMSTRKGTNILLNDLFDRSFGESIIFTINNTKDKETRDKLVLTIGKVVGKIQDALKSKQKVVTYNLQEDWE